MILDYILDFLRNLRGIQKMYRKNDNENQKKKKTRKIYGMQHKQFSDGSL